MSEKKETTEELLATIFKHYQEHPPQKIETDENGVLLLDPNNPHHVEWYEDKDAANLVPDEHLAEYYPELEQKKKASE